MIAFDHRYFYHLVGQIFSLPYYEMYLSLGYFDMNLIWAILMYDKQNVFTYFIFVWVRFD